MLISTSYFLPGSFNLFALSCSSSCHFSYNIHIIRKSHIPEILKSPTLANGSLIKYYLYTSILNNMSDMQCSCPSYFPITALSVSHWLKCSFIPCLVYKLRINQRSLLSTPRLLIISSNLVQSTRVILPIYQRSEFSINLHILLFLLTFLSTN